jgi:SAM-dependent methyltransferase
MPEPLSTGPLRDVDHDLGAALQFNLLTRLGLRESDTLLDIGCGPLRAGRLFIPYLLKGHYYGIEPREDAVTRALELKLGQDMVRIKSPTFRFATDFKLTAFEQRFDFILANSVFSHCSLDMIRTCLLEAVEVMKPDALFLATFARGFEDYTGSAWVFREDQEAGDPGRVVNLTTYTLDTIRKLCNECGLLVDTIDGIHQTGQTWLLMRQPWTGSVRELVQGEVRQSYVHAPRIPEWPSRPAAISLGRW